MTHCNHAELKYHPDPSGNNDSYYECASCYKELTAEDHRIRDQWRADLKAMEEARAKEEQLAHQIYSIVNPTITDEHLITFLEMAGRGCISGAVCEWPQLKPACREAHTKLLRLIEAEKLITELDKLLACGAAEYVPAMADSLQLLHEYRKKYPIE